MSLLDQALALTGEEILAITRPEKVFPKDLTELKHVARKLFSKWHHLASEDRVHTDAFNHIQRLAEEGETRLSEGTWGSSKVLRLSGKTSDLRILCHNEKVMDSFGFRYEGIADNTFYLVGDRNYDLVNLWTKTTFPKLVAGVEAHPTAELRKEFADQIAVLPTSFEMKDGEFLVKVKRLKGYINLADIVETTGPLTIKQVMWITSRLCNLACLMEILDVPNLDISTQSVYVNPETHQLVIGSGWQYASTFTEKALAAPAKTMRMCPSFAKSGIPTIKEVISLVKSTCLTAMGDPHGVNLGREKKVPIDVLNWYLAPPHRTAVESFRLWKKIRNAAFPREFIHWDMQFRHVYPEL